MKISTKYKFLIGLLVISMTLLILFFMNVLFLESSYTVDIINKEPVHRLDAENVLNLIKNEDKSFIKAEQIIEIKGVIREINYLNNRVTILLGADNAEKAFVICDMQRDQKERVSKLNPNDTIKLKGVFKGFLTDAIFLNCIITQPNDE